MTRVTPPDQKHRDAAIVERTRNVIVDAGAGTGKTTLVVRRLVEMLAPRDPAATPRSIDRIAAVTFTRRAAGELRLRIRERLLAELAEPTQPHARRREWLLDALAGLDVAYVGTIHSFADRLLRLRPIEANLSPAYELVEDDDALVRETADVLIQAAQEGTLATQLEGTGFEHEAAEAAQTIVDALAIGVRARSKETEYNTRHGLDGLVGAFVLHRDHPPARPNAIPFDLAAFRAVARELCDWFKPATGKSAGERKLADARVRLERVADWTDPVAIGANLLWYFRSNWKLQKKSFDGNDKAYAGWKAFAGDETQKPVRATAAQTDLLAVFDEWMARRLVRLEPIVRALYDRVKTRRGALDQLDLLLELRDLLARDKATRGYYQGLFDHIFVDEFQDTDPLQAEVLVYLCERTPAADGWRKAQLADGKLTIVGDPKQSIYRFRRADIAMYAEVRSMIAGGPHLEVPLTANFRSRATLLDWLNARFEVVLGKSADGRLFDATTGAVFQQPLAAPIPEPVTPRVHVLPLAAAPGAKDPDFRTLEGQALARYLRWLVEIEKLPVRDPLTEKERPVGFGDIAILAASTYCLDFLLPQLDAMGIPHATRGGRLFLDDPLSKQFLLGLRAIADRDDGIAQAALLRPPFFAIDPLDLLRERAVRKDGLASDERSDRAKEALELVVSLRRDRFQRSPGATARALLEQTAFGRFVAIGPNGTQRLERLRELCHVLDRTAAAEGLDFDGATGRLREWVDAPIGLDPPAPVATDAVQITTVHQAKGLEYPVVILWDGRAKWPTRQEAGPWLVGPDGKSWVLNLADLEWEHPSAAGDLRGRDLQYRLAEHRRVLYVAATRARDLLVLPHAGDLKPNMTLEHLIEETPGPAVKRLAPYDADGNAPWAKKVKEPPPTALRFDRATEERLTRDHARAVELASRPTLRPTAISSLEPEELGVDDQPRVRRPSRFGPAFGTAVHQAIGLVLRLPTLLSRHASLLAGVPAALADEAARDVDRALAALESLQLRHLPSEALRLEYPIAQPGPEGSLLIGFIDLVAVVDGKVTVIDFKTDAPPAAGATIPEYATQVRTYGQVLLTAGVTTTPPRCGLLFTADGTLRWCD